LLRDLSFSVESFLARAHLVEILENKIARTFSPDAHYNSESVPVVEDLSYVRAYQPFFALNFSHASTYGILHYGFVFLPSNTMS